MTAATYLLGAVVPLTFHVKDAGGDLADAGAVTLTITLPNGTTESPTPTNPETGVYLYDYTPAAGGRYVARFVATGANAGADEDAFDVLAANTGQAPTLAEVKLYLGDVSESDAEVQAALDAERIAQTRRCSTDTYPPDLVEALKRRVARNLAARRVPLATYTAFENGGGTSTRVPMGDAEIDRLEKPHRRMTAR